MANPNDQINSRLDALAQRPFRAKFHLVSKELAIARDKGLPTIRQHAADLLGKRIFPGTPKNDGKQTPYKGHLVFVAQHATATCCRTCLERWHKIPKGLQVGPVEQDYILDVIQAWILREVARDLAR